MAKQRIMSNGIGDLPPELLATLDAEAAPDVQEALEQPPAFRPLPTPPPEPERTGVGIIVPDEPVPGMMLQAAPVRRMPPREMKHASLVFPTLFPKPADQAKHPGVFLDRQTGRPVTPRRRDGGQYSLLLVEIGSPYDEVIGTRKVVIPQGTPETEWGLTPDDEVKRITEVVFDFEDMRDKALKACNVRTQNHDPLGQRLDPNGVPLDMGPVPSLTGHANGR